MPDGTGIRNYLYSSVFKDRDAHLTLLHHFNKDITDLIQEHTEIDKALELPRFRESVLEKKQREQSHISRLHYHSKLVNNPTIIGNYRPKQGSLKKRLFYKVVEYLAVRNSDYSSILKVEQQYERQIKKNAFYKEVKKLLKQQRPDVVFLTHQRAVQAAYVFAAARDLGIKTITVIYSWDNLSKARLHLRADRYLVWSEHMKEEMALFYPEIDTKKVIVTGTPQFEFYRDKDRLVSREDFAQSNGLNPDKKWLCYSGDDVLTSPNDPVYLEHLAIELSKPIYNNAYQILFRRCPVDHSDRFKKVIRKYPTIIKEVEPLWLTAEVWTSIFPQEADSSLLANTVFHSEAVFNIGSTMAFDFLQYDKPCVYINYDIPTNLKWSVHTTYQYQHFRSMPSKKAVFCLDAQEDLEKVIREIQEHQFSLKETKKWFDTVVSYAYHSSDLIYNEIIS